MISENMGKARRVDFLEPPAHPENTLNTRMRPAGSCMSEDLLHYLGMAPDVSSRAREMR